MNPLSAAPRSVIAVIYALIVVRYLSADKYARATLRGLAFMLGASEGGIAKAVKKGVEGNFLTIERRGSPYTVGLSIQTIQRLQELTGHGRADENHQGNEG